MGWDAGERDLIFYADYERICGRDHIWVQDTLTVPVAMLLQVGAGDKTVEYKGFGVHSQIHLWEVE